MSTGLADNVRKFRRAAGLSQEGLADAADLSLGTIRKVEQGGDVRVATLHVIARALGVQTSDLFSADAPKSVVSDADSANLRHLADLRSALTPPIGMASTLPTSGDVIDTGALLQRVRDLHALYDQDRYTSVARALPDLLRSAEASVTALDGNDRSRAEIARCHVLLFTGKFLIQTRQYDMAYHTISEAIRIARESGKTLLTATGINGLCWLLLRQDRFTEAENLAAQTASDIEPRMTEASKDHLAVWGELWLRVAAASRRNNRPDVASEARRMARTAGSAVGREYAAFPHPWGTFGPITTEAKAVEDLMLDGDARGVLSHADQGALSSSAAGRLGKMHANNWGRHRLDVASAHASLGSHQDALEELIGLRHSAGVWLTHQPMARHVMTDILHSRKRTLTQDMREMAAHLNIAG